MNYFLSKSVVVTSHDRFLCILAFALFIGSSVGKKKRRCHIPPIRNQQHLNPNVMTVVGLLSHVARPPSIKHDETTP